MTPTLVVHRAGPGVTVQDAGRPGYLAQGLSMGGAADRLALAEGAALLGQADDLPALEIAASFLTVEATVPMRIALTGMPMRARVGDGTLAWNASHMLPAGSRLELSGSEGGYSYLHLGGGLALPRVIGGASAHLAAGLGNMVQAADRLPLGTDKGVETSRRISPLPRFEGGTLRVVTSLQTGVFDRQTRERFEATIFRKEARANRMGQAMRSDGPGFSASSGLTILSEIIVPGDIQIIGDGTPFVLLSECQTTGGYPRIGTVLPCDLPRLVQAPTNATLRFRFVALDEAVEAETAEARRRAGLRKELQPLLRDPRDIPDLLAYQLISGVTCGDDLERRSQ